MDEMRESRRYRLGTLWQLPLLLLAVAAAVGVWQVRTHWLTPESRRFQRYLDGARQALAQNPPNTQQVLKHAEDMLQLAPEFAGHGEACFLVGSARYFLAQASNGSFAQDQWVLARDLLEQAEKLGVPAQDRSKLHARLGIMLFRSGDDAQRVIDYLKGADPEACDNATAVYSMLAQCYLRLPEPNYTAALEANQKLLGLPIDDETVLGPARLQSGEILLELKKPVEARQVLSRISADAPADIYMKARLLQARSCQEAKLWQDAAKLWQEVLADRRMSPPDQGRILADLGICQRELGQTAQAVVAWESSLKHEGPHKTMAEIALADYYLSSKKADKAMSYLERLARVETKNLSKTELADVRRLSDKAAQVYVESGDPERCARIYSLFGATASPAKVLEKTAQAYENRALKNPDEAKACYEQAAAAYAKLAETDSERKANWYWKSADRYAQAEQYTQSLAQLECYVHAETTPERLGQAWLLTAQCYQAMDQMPTARAAYKKCIEFPGAAAFGARLELAKIDVQGDKLDEAEETLKQNLELMRVAAAGDSAIHEQSLYTYADLLFKRNNYRLAALRLQEALDRYPKNANARKSRQQLADSYRWLASQEHQNLRFGEGTTPDAQTHYRDQYQAWLKLAATSYQKLADDLRGERSSKLLSKDEDDLLRRAEFAVAECRFDLGQYAEARVLYDKLAEDYKDRIETLSALRQLWRCCWVLRQGDDARATVKRAEEILKAMDPGVFAEQPDKYQEWQRWLEWAAKQ